MRKNFTLEQMLHTVRQVAGGLTVAGACRKIESQNKPSTLEAPSRWQGIAELA